MDDDQPLHSYPARRSHCNINPYRHELAETLAGFLIYFVFKPFI